MRRIVIKAVLVCAGFIALLLVVLDRIDRFGNSIGGAVAVGMQAFYPQLREEPQEANRAAKRDRLRPNLAAASMIRVTPSPAATQTLEYRPPPRCFSLDVFVCRVI